MGDALSSVAGGWRGPVLHAVVLTGAMFAFTASGLEVSDTSPTHAAIHVPVDAGITVLFSGPVSNGTIHSGTMKVSGRQSGPCTGTYSFAPVKFTPSTPFKPGEEIDVMLTTGIVSVAGASLEAHSFSFRTMSRGCSNVVFEKIDANFGPPRDGVTLGDLDRDGDLDAFLFTRDGSSVHEVWFNTGTGTFTNSGQMLHAGQTYNIVLGDMDNDGDMDALEANAATGTYHHVFWINDGSGFFHTNSFALPNGFYRDADLGDMDGDGYLDCVSVMSGGTSNCMNEVWLNAADGTFTNSGQNLRAGDNYYGVKLADLDNDGDLDALFVRAEFVAGFVQVLETWTNNGRGTLTLAYSTNAASQSFYYDLADVDQDGDLDALMPNTGGSPRLWVNDGSGRFMDSGQYFDRIGGGRSQMADLDGDGDLDAVFSIYSHRGVRVWMNDGGGTFTDSGFALEFAPEVMELEGVDIGDVDGDGDVDIVIASHSPSGFSLWLNRGCRYETDPDTDWDLIPDAWESAHGMDPTNATDAGIDCDRDGPTGWEEYMADTSPTNPLSYLRIDQIERTSAVSIYFEASTSRVYSLHYLSYALSPDWVNLTGPQPARGKAGENVLTDTNGATHGFYRLEVNLP